MNSLNPYGAWTLFLRETRRFLKVHMQTVVAPALTALLYVLIFRYAMGSRTVPGLGVDYLTFLIPGLVMMAMLQNAFANTSSSIIVGKVMNVHIYLLMAPLSAMEIILALVASAVVRAFIVAAAILAALWAFVDIPLSSISLVMLYGLCGSMLMAGLGIIAGIWAEKFDDIALISNFVIMPLTFLSGVFYSVAQLPPFWQQVNRYNPFFYLIDGFRHGFVGVGDTDPYASIDLVAGATGLCMLACWLLWRMGWRMKP